jgi:hypothetical protein
MIRLAVLGSIAAQLIGCTDNPSIVILRNVEPGADCTIDPSNTILQGSGLLDVTNPLPNGAPNLGYLFTPAISNPALGSASTSSSPSNPSARIFFLQGANVEIIKGPGDRSTAAVAALENAGLASRTIRIGSSIEPGGLIGLGFRIIDFEQVATLNQVIGPDPVTVVARVTVFGERDDTDVESLPFEYPVTLCLGCLIFDAGPCSGITMGADLPQGGVCNLVQDEVLSCCSTDFGTTQCPAKAPDATM